MKTLTTVLTASLCVSTLAGGTAAYQAWRYRTAAIEAQTVQNAGPEANEMALHRQIVLRDAGFPPVDDQVATSRAIRDWVYRTNKVGQGDDHGWNPALIYAHLGQDGHEQICGGMSSAYYWALNAVDIPARIVQLASEDYLAGEDSGGTHVTVEAYIDGEWRVSDPTFNAEFTCSTGDAALSITDMQQCVADGGHLVPVPGETQLPDRTVEEYYLPYEALLAAFARTPVSTPEVSAPAEEVPSGWLQDNAELTGQSP